MRRLRGWLTWQRVPVAALRIDRPRREATALALYAVAYVGLAAGAALIIRAQPRPLLGAVGFTHDATYVLGFKLAALLIVPIVGLAAWGYRARDVLAGWRASPRAIAVVALGLAIGLALNLGRLAPALAALHGRNAGEVAGLLAAALALPLLAAALPEELVYRALLQTRLEATLGRGAALALSAALFAAWHLPSRYLLADGVEGHAGDLGSVLVGTGVPVFVMGLVFGWLWDRYRDLPLLVALHLGVDVLPSLSALVGVHG